ncbi:MAG: hypothetical protein H7Z42_05895 [Roseiflexaceae bacterium]|nr:hypothetical protein [Roseiflexaceae bacterium]
MASISTVQAQAIPAARVRWALLTWLTALALLGAFGNAWDLYWHIFIGRDTFWIPPHTMMYTCVALSGLSALVVVLLSTRHASSDDTTAIAGFRAPLGYYVLGIGALQMVASAPFDDWWHRVYGLDVTVWSPPHLIGFSGAVVMLCGTIIATTAQMRRHPPTSRRERLAYFWLLALLFALVVRWITFLNSTTLELSWELQPARDTIARPWAPWWGLWAGFAMAWTFLAAARLAPALPLATLALALLMRGLEFVVSGLGFRLVLPWGNQTFNEPFVIFFDYDLGLWVATGVLVLPALLSGVIARWGKNWGALRFGLVGGALWGLLLAAQFLLLRQPLTLMPLGVPQAMQVVLVTLGSALVGGLLGAWQGGWLARFRR